LIAAVLALALLAAPYERVPLGVGDVDWLERPTAEDFGRFDPHTTAWPDNVLVVLECVIARGGRLDPCRVIEVAGRDNGEVAATLRLASKFRLTQRTKSGESTMGRKVRIPIRWMPPE
jgi:hypothetical protein